MPTPPDASPVEHPEAPAPRGWFLSNGRVTVLITDAGTGFTSVDDCRLNPWSGDRIEDRDGFFVYLRDLDTGAVWSAGRKPVARPPARYSAVRKRGAFEIARTDNGITSRMEIWIPPDLPVELRRITLVNDDARPRRIELTSYVEVCLGAPAAYAAHPAFSKLFVQTAAAMEGRALLATRRPRARGESHPCMIHALLEPAEVQCETDRARFLGRLRDVASPIALESNAPLSGSTGNVLDPALCLRRTADLAAGGSAVATFLLGATADRDEALDIFRRLAATSGARDSLERAREHETRALREMGLGEPEAEYAQGIAAAMLYGHPALRAAPDVLSRAHGCLSDLENVGLSQRRPFALIDAVNPAGARLLPDLLRMHRYWESMALGIDLLVLCDDAERSRAQAGNVRETVRFAPAADIAPAFRDLIAAAARLVVIDRLPDLGMPPPRLQP